MAVRVLMASDEDANLLEQLLRALRHPHGSGGVQVSMQPGRGLTVSLRRRAAVRPSQVDLARFLIVGQGGDYYSAYTLDDDDTQGADLVYIAKPHALQRTPWHGQTVNGYTYTYDTTAEERESDDGTTTEDQIITPSVVYSHDQIMAITGINGGTGVTDPNDDPVTWQAVDVPYRWAAKSE